MHTELNGGEGMGGRKGGWKSTPTLVWILTSNLTYCTSLLATNSVLPCAHRPGDPFEALSYRNLTGEWGPNHILAF